MKKLTPEQLEEKKLLDRIHYMTNRVRGAFSFGHIKTFKDILKECGTPTDSYFPSELNRQVTIKDVNDYLSDRRIELTTALWLKRNPPVIEDEHISTLETTRTQQYDNQGSNSISQGSNKMGECSDKIRATNNKETPEVSETTSKEIQVELVTDNPYDKDYGLSKSPNESPNLHLFWFQKKATKNLLDGILGKGKSRKPGQQLVGGTGVGKTFICGAVIRRLIDQNWHIGKTVTPWPYLVVTRSSIVEQTKRVFKQFFNIDTTSEVLVINIEQLRAEFGKRFLTEEMSIIQGEEVVKWKWRKNLYPIFIWFDENQALKNTDSIQSKIAQSYNDIEDDNITQIFASATPFTRVCETKCFCVATRIPYKFGLASFPTPLTNDHWNMFEREVSNPHDPKKHSPQAVERLMERMQDYIERVKGVKPQFKAINSVEVCEFENEKDRIFYEETWERHLAEVAKIKGDEGLTSSQSRFMILVEILKFRMAAELIHVPDIVKRMYHGTKEGFAACSALNFKGSIIRAVQLLVNDYNVPRSKISIIWGGGQTQPNKKQKAKAAIKGNKDAMDLLSSMGITMEDLDLDDVEDVKLEELDPALKLGTQSLKERQREIDNFQKGESLFCFYTFRAGGVGLSLHHTDEFTREKVRHKDSGYSYEEDIPNIPTRQRLNFVAPTYSAMELVQGLGRCPRLTSLSDTRQILLFYKGTIEERVARIVALKLKCLSKVVRQREDWSTIMEDGRVGGSKDDAAIEGESTIKQIENDDSEDSGLIGDEEE